MPIEKTLYDSVGGDAGLDRLTAAFIRVLLADPQLEELRSIYAGRDLAHYEARFVLKEPSPKWLNHSSIQIAENTSKTPHVSDNMRRFLIHSGPTFILTLEPLGINL